MSVFARPGIRPGYLFTAIFLSFGLANASLAQSTSGEELRRQQERERLLRERMERTPDVRIQAEPSTEAAAIPAEPDLPCFNIDRIEFDSDVPAQLSFLLEALEQAEPPFVGQCLGSRGINRLLTHAQNLLVGRGYVTSRVVAAPQDLTKGTLKLKLIAGRIRALNMAPPSTSIWGNAKLWPLAEGDLLNLRNIEQSLENLKRSPTAEADIQIEPAEGEGAQAGESDLAIKYQQGFPLRASLSVDDGGSKYTGRYQGNATLSYDNPLGLNDLLYVSANHDLGGGVQGSRGTKGGSAFYAIPFGYWLLSTNYSENTYFQSVAGLNQTYVYSGESRNQDVKLSYLFSRDAVQKSTVSLRAFLRTSNNFIDDTEVEVQKRRTAGWELGVTHRRYFGDNVLDASLAYRHGTGAWGALPAPEQEFGEGTSRMEVINADLNFSAPFQFNMPWGTQRLRYLGTFRGQYNQTPLTPQDRFSIGNRYSVRGFDGEFTLSSDRGWFVRNDIGAMLGNSNHEAYLGIDYGAVGGRTAAFLTGRQLAGAVIGLRGAIGRLNYDIFTGAPLKKPDSFPTSGQIAGFSLVVSF